MQNSNTNTEIMDLLSFLFWKYFVEIDVSLDSQLLGYVIAIVC